MPALPTLDLERRDSVADDVTVTEQTVDADDAMAIEERQRDAAAAADAGAGRREVREAEPARDGAAGQAKDGGAEGEIGNGDDETVDDLGAFGGFG